MLPARLPKSAIRRTYSWIAPTHDILAALVEARARQLGLTWAAVQDGERVLEVAVGTGLSFRELLAANPSGWTDGIDLTPAMLVRARKRAERCGHARWSLGLGDAYTLEVAGDSYDLVLNSYMLDLLPACDFEQVLREFKRVLVPGGRLVLINMTIAERAVERVWETLYSVWPPLLGGCRGVVAAPALEKAGFHEIRRAYVSQRTFPSEVLFARKAL